MKIKQKLSTIFTLFVYITSLFLSVASAVPVAHAAVDSSNVSLELKNTDAAGRTEYLTGEKISTSIHLGYTGDEPVSGVLRIKVKAEHLAVNSETDLFGKPHPLTNSREWFKGQEDGYYYVEYTLSNVEGGSNIALPLGFSLKQGTTPQGFQTDVIAEVEIDGLETITKQLVFTSKIQPAQLYHYVESLHNNGSTARKMIDGKSVLEAGVTYPEALPSVPTNTPNDESRWARYIIGLDSSRNSYGNYTPQTATITYKMPVGARLRGTGTYNGGGKDFTWTYDAASHTATYTGPLTEAKTAYIELAYPDRPYADVHTSAASMVTDSGTVNQFDYVPIEEHIKWLPYKATPPTPPPGGPSGRFAMKVIHRDRGGNGAGYGSGARNSPYGVVWNPDRTSVDVALDTSSGTGAHNTETTLFSMVSASDKRYTYIEEFVEKEIDSRLYFHSWSLEIVGGDAHRAYQDMYRKGFNIYGVKANGEEVLLAEEVKRDSGRIIDPETGQPDVTGKYIKLRFVFLEPLRLGTEGHMTWGGQGIGIRIHTPVQPAIWESWTVDDLVYADDRNGDVSPPDGSPHRMYAAADYVVHTAGLNGENKTPTENIKANQVGHVRSWVSAMTVGDERVSTYYRAVRTEVGSWTGEPQELVVSTGEPDDAFMIKGDIDILQPVDSSRISMKQPKLITLLPQGLEFVPGSETHGMAGKAQVVENYKGTGMTAVIIPFDDIEWDSTNKGNTTETSPSWHANKVERYVEFKVNPTEYLEYGDNIVKQYLIWDNNTDILPPADLTRTQKQPYADALDLDNDGDTAEIFLEGSNRVIYNPPFAVSLRKYISRDKNLWSPKVSELMDIDSDFFYKITVSNRLGNQVDNVSVVDVLPFVGDKRIVANQRGAYLDRNSQFAASLTNSVESLPENAAFLAKWDVLYSTESQGATTDATVNATFVPATSITNWSEVKMVKFVMKPGAVLTASDVSEAILPAKVPNRTDLDLFAKANNTAALKVPAILDSYLEGSTVSAQVARYAVTGVAYHDVNKDGDKDRNEPVLSDYTVQLMNQADDTPVLDPVTGQEITAITNAQGVYKMDVFKRGQYYIKVIKKEANETFTRLYQEGGQPKPGTSSVKDGVIGNDTENIDDTAGRTAAFDLNPSVIPAGLEGQTKAQQAKTLATEDNTLLAVRNIGFDNVNVKLDITVTKSWDDANNQDGKRPRSITVNLLANGTKVDTATISDNAGTWSHTFTEKPKYENGREIVYTVEEETVTGYTATVTGTVADGFTITNSYTPEVVDVPVKKVWEDADNQDGKRPANLEVVVTKTVDGVTSDTAHTTTLSGAGNEWTHTFTGLPKYEAGKRITYGVKEVTVPAGYTSRVTDTTITNSYTPETTEVSVKKEWDDANNQDGKRPASITVKLLADNDEYQEKTIDEGDNWTHTFTNLPRYKNGREIVYTIAEEAVTGYTSVTIGDAATGFTITNSYTPELVNVPVRKVWDDADNQDGKRPASITVNLLADGVEVQEQVVTEADLWAHTFSNLPKFNSGREIVYTITEDEVDAYTPTIADTPSGFEITNKHVPELVTIEGTKTWDDANDQDGKRPEFITVRLFANGEEVADVKVDADADWKYAFKDVPKYKDGQEIVYTITEDEVEGYTTTIDGYNITNSYTPEVVTVSGKKVWKDEADQDGIRPDSITVNLLAYGKEVADVKVVADANDNWTYEFTNLPKYEGGKEIHYTVTEDAVEGYTTSIKGTTITNTHKPAKTSLKVVKVWKDDNNKAQKRPDSITVQLVADGKEVKGKTLVLNAANNWQADFTALDKNKNGQAIVYTVKEVTVPEGYTSTVEVKDGVATITNTYTAKTVLKPLPKTGQATSILGFLGFILLGLALFFRKRLEA